MYTYYILQISFLLVAHFSRQLHESIAFSVSTYYLNVTFNLKDSKTPVFLDDIGRIWIRIRKLLRIQILHSTGSQTLLVSIPHTRVLCVDQERGYGGAEPGRYGAQVPERGSGVPVQVHQDPQGSRRGHHGRLEL